ncbi:MAG: hypothetical protein QOD54_543 [Sphingomonadales bacterium]|jgi:hypothetical protein|nr:hypothetical protein [Sphingomonadales bacterium]
MSSRSFRSVFMVASCAGAALGCYMVSLRVASERAQLEAVEGRIVLAQRDMRVLQTEIGTRGRLSQLERWNAGAFALAAPSADQFLKGGFELARLAQPEHKVDFQAPVVLASAPAPAKPSPVGQAGTDDSGAAAAATTPNALLHVASLKTETREVPARTVVALPQTTAISTGKPATSAKPANKPSVEKPGLAAAQPKKPVAKAAQATGKKSVDKAPVITAQAVTRPVRLAKVDPLALLPAKHSKGPTAER